tara:strand:+ start:664 stop:852 length:189 start_codon:yes stop_codon:yes gene_type:complete
MKLDQFLKFHGLVGTGGEAKIVISEGSVRVNGFEERRRGRKLVDGDCISFADVEYIFSDSKP